MPSAAYQHSMFYEGGWIVDGLRQYIFSVTAAALICSILMSLVRGGFAKELIRLVCGLLLTLTVLRPMVNLDFGIMDEYPASLTRNAESVSAEGERMAKETMTDIIKAQSEAYILDKAAAWNASVSVDITVGDSQIPESAVLRGEISPQTREHLEVILETDLGITKENQIWTG